MPSIVVDCESITTLQYNVQGSKDISNFITIPWGNHFGECISDFT